MKQSTFVSTIGTLFLLITIASSQSSRGGSTQVISQPPFTKIGVEAWSAGGASVAEVGLPSAPFTNPALMHFTQMSLYIEAGKRLPTKWLADIDYDGQFIVPAFISLGTRIGEWDMALGYSNSYNRRYAISIMETTPQSPEGTGRTFDFESTVKIHSFFGSVKHDFDSQNSFGLTAGLNYLKNNESLIGVSAGGTGFGMLLIVGTLLKPSPSISIGGIFEYSSTMNYEFTYELSSLPFLPAPQPGSLYVAIPEVYRYTATFPWKLQAGFDWQATSMLNVLASLEFQRWSIVDDTYRDQLQIHLGTAIVASPILSLRFGFFTQSEPYNTLLDQHFLTGGFRLSVAENIFWSASLLDSHLFSNGSETHDAFRPVDDQFHQTYISTAIECSL